MIKKLAVAALVALAAPMTSQAQPTFAGDLGSLNVCPLDIFVMPVSAVIKCAGFYEKNAISGNATDLPSAQALDAFGPAKLNVLSTSTSIIEKISSWNGVASTDRPMYGFTVLGMHWGNGSVFGNVSAFYVLNLPSAGTNDVSLRSDYRDGISNLAVYETGRCDDNCVPVITSVPEPSTYALMASGLLGIFGVARRRRRNVA